MESVQDLKRRCDELLKGKIDMKRLINRDCEYIRGDKCMATRQESCYKCRFFQPSYAGYLRLMLEYCESKKLDEKEIDIANLKAENKRLTERIKRLKDKLAEKEGRKCSTDTE
jgi:flagellar motility protein MotE (MotC chaperone)